MASEEIVKIRIQANADDFKAVSDAVQKSLQDIGKQAEITSGKIKSIGAGLNNTSGVFNSSTDALKKNNQQWTNLALVIQDLPFGFRGIQNNLPALMGSIAGIAGPLYFVGSAVIAFFTAWDMGAFGAKNATDAWRESIKKTNDEIKGTLDYSNQEISKLQSLISIATNYTNAESLRSKALKEIKEDLSKVNKEEADRIKNIGQAIISVNLYTEALRAQQLAEVTGKKIAELQMQVIEDRNALEIESAKSKREIHPLDFLGITDSDAQKLQNKIIQTEGFIRRLQDLNEGAVKSSLLNPFGDKSDKVDKEKVDKSLLEKLTAQYDYYKDNLFLAGYYGKLMIEEEKRVALKEAEINGASKEVLDNINQTYRFKELTLLQGVENQKLRIRQQSAQRQKQLTDQYNKDIYDAQVEYAKNYTKILDAQLKIEMKRHKDNTSLQQDDINQKIKMLQFALVFANGNEKATNVIIESIKKYKSELEGLGTVSTTINEILKNTLVKGFESVGETLGNLISKGSLSFDSLAGILADALIEIGKALVMYSSLVKAAKAALEKGEWKAGIVIGIAAIAAGYALKNSLGNTGASGSSPSMGKSSNPAKRFADGGIISGPTYGLMGEYPGAKNNPEVVAPLDKLKNLIGGGSGGTFLLRGQDLLLSVNRAQKASNLKGQNISLA